MALPKLESFTTGADQTLQAYDANWVADSGELSVTAATDTVEGTIEKATYYWNGDVFNADQYAQMTQETGGAITSIGPYVRINSGDNSGYYFLTNGTGTNDSFFGEISADTYSDIGGDRGNFDPGDVAYIEFNGNAWDLKKNDASLATGTDGTHATGQAGLGCFSVNLDGDNWEGGNLATAKAPNQTQSIIMGKSKIWPVSIALAALPVAAAKNNNNMTRRELVNIKNWLKSK